MNIYLAGGFHSGWQSKVKRIVPQHNYYDPMVNSDQRFAYRFTQQDIVGMKNCDMVFAYFELNNPSGLGLAVEIGWATILNKPIIFVDEHKKINLLLASCSKQLYTDLDVAIEYLKNLNKERIR